MGLFSQLVGNRVTGPVFRQRRCLDRHDPPLSGLDQLALERELALRNAEFEKRSGEEPARSQKQTVAQSVWRDVGALRNDWIRIEFMRLTAAIGFAEITAPKTFRHTLATTLQDANVDPLIRNELMGHAPTSVGSVGRESRSQAEGSHLYRVPSYARLSLQSPQQQRIRGEARSL